MLWNCKELATCGWVMACLHKNGLVLWSTWITFGASWWKNWNRNKLHWPQPSCEIFGFVGMLWSLKKILNVVQATIREQEEYTIAFELGPPSSTRQAQIRWLLLISDSVKLNWDASLNMSNKRMDIGIVIRDEKGEVLAYLSSSLLFYLQPIVAECQALLRALSFCIKLGLQQGR